MEAFGTLLLFRPKSQRFVNIQSQILRIPKLGRKRDLPLFAFEFIKGRSQHCIKASFKTSV